MANHRVALIIGNAAYEPPMKLTNPVNDAALLTRTLVARGYQIVGGASTERNQTPYSEGQDPKLGGMLELFSKFIEAVEQGAKTHGATDAVIYYAGHALQVLDKNLLVPIDPNFSGPNPLLGLVDVKRFISRATEVAGTDGSVVAFLDSCRDLGLTNEEMNRVLDAYKREYPVAHTQQDEGVEAPEQSRSRAATIGTGMSTFKMPRSPTAARTFIGFATAPGEVTYDGPKSNQNSPFAMILAKHLDVRGLEIEELYNRVALDVTDEVDSWNVGRPPHRKPLHQDPWSESNLNRNLYVYRRSSMPVWVLAAAGFVVGLIVTSLIFRGGSVIRPPPDWVWGLGVLFGLVSAGGTLLWGSRRPAHAFFAFLGPVFGFAVALAVLMMIPDFPVRLDLNAQVSPARRLASDVFYYATLIGMIVYFVGIIMVRYGRNEPRPRSFLGWVNRAMTWTLPALIAITLICLDQLLAYANPYVTAVTLCALLSGILYATSVELGCRPQLGLFTQFGAFTGAISVGLMMAILFAAFAWIHFKVFGAKLPQDTLQNLMIVFGGIWHLLLGAQLGYCFAYYVPDHERKKMP